MEVHKHPHHPMERKRWGEYFLEFFMIFLAVFLGFLAENWREHIVDRRREKELMQAFVNDLRLDTSQLSALVRDRGRHAIVLDSTILFYSKQQFARVPLVTYQKSTRLFGLNFFYPNTGTLDQLKNSGGFRLIRHRQIIDSIERYDRQIKRMEKRDAFEGEVSVRERELVEKIFDGKGLSKIYADSILFSRQDERSFLAKSSYVINLNTQYIDEYLNLLINFRALSRADTNVEVELKDIATHLIELIRREYHLK